MPSNQDKPRPGQQVVLVSLPDGFLDALPQEDQQAITAIIGVPLALTGYEDGRAVLDFVDTARSGHHHTIFVDPEYIRACP